jgi:hypothetical protein
MRLRYDSISRRYILAEQTSLFASRFDPQPVFSPVSGREDETDRASVSISWDPEANPLYVQGYRIGTLFLGIEFLGNT